MRKKKVNEEEEPRTRPPDAFCEWWNPSGTDAISGASIGGHPEAERVWARKDPGRFARRTYGINAVLAWTTVMYREEYLRWIDADRPEQEPFVSMCMTLEQQKAFYKQLSGTLAQIGKPMPTEDKQPLPLPEGVVDAEFTKLDEDGDEPIPF
jgi:hypothetical protein